MARDFGRIWAKIWSDREFLAQDQGTQRLYLFLCSQQNLNKAGVLPVTLRRWSTSAPDLTPEEVWDMLVELAAQRFIVWDADTEEVLIRTYIRHDEIYKQPNLMRSAVAAAEEIVSPKLRLALLRELDRLPLEEVSDAPPPKGGPSARQVVVECIETIRRGLFAVEDKRSPSLPETLPERVPGTLPGTLNQPRPEAPFEATPNASRNEISEVPQGPHTSHHEPHTSQHEPHEVFGVSAVPERSDREEPQVSADDGDPPEWVPETLPETPHARARAHHARLNLELGPSDNPKNLSPSAGADGGAEAPKSKTRSRKAKPREHPRFAEFWGAYGHKVERLAAMKAFNQAIEDGADPDELIAAAGRYARRCKRLGLDRHHIKHASGWLNGERWTDEIEDDDASDSPGSNQPPRHGQPGPADACRWCDNGLFEHVNGRLAPCDHPEQPPAGHPAAEPARSPQ